MAVPSTRRARSCIWRSIRWASCWRCMSSQTARMTAPRLGAWRRRCGIPPGRASIWPLPTRAEPASGPVRPPGRVASRGSGEAAGGQARRRAAAAAPGARAAFAWATRFRRLVKDSERYANTLTDLHRVAFACLMLKQAALLAAGP
jgi:hypothetical protein